MRLIDADVLLKQICETTHTESNAGLLRLLTGLVNDAPTVGQWISVKDKLPESKPDDLEYPAVIIALPDGSVEMGCYYESTCEWGAGEWFDEIRKPIAWMALPEPPEEVKQAE